LIAEFLIDYSQKLSENNFEDKNGGMFLKKKESYKLIKTINELFDKWIKHQRVKKYGEHSKIRTAIRKEPIKLVQYLRGEKDAYGSVRDIL